MIRDFRQITATAFFAVCTILLLAACESDDAPPETSSPAATSEASRSTSAGHADTARFDATADPQRAVVGETLAYAEVDEQLVKGYFVFPEDMVEPLPAIILIHEWWGLNDDIRGLADRLAGEGYIVLAVDLFAGRTAAASPEARNLMLEVMAKPALAEENIRRACQWLFATTGAPNVGTIGYGFGGGWALNAAIALPDQLDAVVIYYGQLSDNEETLAPIEAPILGIFGSADSVIPPQAVAGFESALENLQKTYLIKSIAGGKGGFATPGSRNFHDGIAAQAWELMLGFLQEHMVSDEEE